MAKAPPNHVSNASRKPKGKPYDRPEPTGNGAGETSISKLKASLRSAKRLLAKGGLNAQLKVETERRLESLQAALKDAEKSRDKLESSSNEPKGKDEDTAATTSVKSNEVKKKNATTSGKGIKKTEGSEKRQKMYKMLKHVEYQKTARKLKTAKKEVTQVQQSIQELGQNESAKKEMKKLQKALAAAEEQLVKARVDAWYVATFPAEKKYVALFPSGEYVEHTGILSTASFPEDRLANFPSAKNPDAMRSYWRSVVRFMLDNKELQGEPVKEKKKNDLKRKKDEAAEAEVDGDNSGNDDEAADDNNGTSTSSSSESDNEDNEPQVNLDEDEFFA